MIDISLMKMADDQTELKYPYSRCSSAGSLHNLTSSANNSDDEDSDLGSCTPSHQNNNLKDKRRVAHTQAEQKRRDSIKKGYDYLTDLVPMKVNGGDGGQQCKLSKATVLQKSIDYMQYLQNGNKKQEEELSALKNQAVAMTILKMKYDQVVANNNQQPGNAAKQVSDQLKFQVFRTVLDSLYQTFEPSIATNNFADISGSVISWLEEHCKPQNLREIMCGVLQQVHQHEAAQVASAQPPQHHASNDPSHSSINKTEMYY